MHRQAISEIPDGLRAQKIWTCFPLGPLVSLRGFQEAYTVLLPLFSHLAWPPSLHQYHLRRFVLLLQPFRLRWLLWARPWTSSAAHYSPDFHDKNWSGSLGNTHCIIARLIWMGRSNFYKIGQGSFKMEISLSRTPLTALLWMCKCIIYLCFLPFKREDIWVLTACRANHL